MRSKLTLIVIFVLAAVSFMQAAAVQQGSASSQVSPQLRKDIDAAIQRAVTYLLQNQRADGCWGDHIGITALAATGILQQPGNSPSKKGPEVQKALAFVAGLAKPDGGIYDKATENYSTAVSMMALVASGKPEYKPLIDKGQKYILGIQVDESKGVNKDDKTYGGIGYNSKQRPDLPNLEYALEALKASGLSDKDPAWQRALQFIQRTQNRSESNDQSYSGNDGGFAYSAGLGWQNTGTGSYGSMTYTGLLSYSYANVKKGDPRVEAAVNWIRDHYTLDENPGLGQKTLYYYYMVFAKALRAYGDPVIVDSKGRSHNWREELGRKILELQHPEGYWVNTDPAEWQDNKALVTAFTLLALENTLQ